MEIYSIRREGTDHVAEDTSAEGRHHDRKRRKLRFLRLFDLNEFSAPENINETIVGREGTEWCVFRHAFSFLDSPATENNGGKRRGPQTR